MKFSKDVEFAQDEGGWLKNISNGIRVKVLDVVVDYSSVSIKYNVDEATGKLVVYGLRS